MLSQLFTVLHGLKVRRRGHKPGANTRLKGFQENQTDTHQVQLSDPAGTHAPHTFWRNEVWEGSQHKAHVPYKEVH
jgi:hypothetical protein